MPVFMSKPIIYKSVSTLSNTQLRLKGKSVTKETVCNEFSVTENGESEDEDDQGDIEINEDEYPLFLFVDKLIDVIVRQFKTLLESSGCNIATFKIAFLKLVSAIFIKLLFFHQMISLQKL